MPKRLFNESAPFQTITATARITGLSMYYLRSGCKDGTIQHVKSGATYYINVPALLSDLGVRGDIE